MLADRPVTGGYPVPACVIRADVGRVAQLRPGGAVRFEMASPDGAAAEWRAAEDALDAVEPLGQMADDEELGWIGSHR
jgi:allophanate hydrolase subunit 2